MQLAISRRTVITICRSAEVDGAASVLSRKVTQHFRVRFNVCTGVRRNGEAVLFIHEVARVLCGGLKTE